MTSRLTKLSLILTFLTCLTPAIAAQEGQGGDLTEKMQASRRKLAQKRARSDAEIIESKPMSAEELRNARSGRGAIV
jgi:hypothetical protein